MVGLSKIVTVLVTAMAVLCLAGIAGPAFAQTYSDPMYGGKGIASSNVGMGKGIPQTANVGANANAGLSKGVSKGGYGGYGMDMGFSPYGLGCGCGSCGFGWC